jgi:hypothetical protein
LYLLKRLDNKKFYLGIQERRQIHSCIPEPKNSNIKKYKSITLPSPA